MKADSLRDNGSPRSLDGREIIALLDHPQLFDYGRLDLEQATSIRAAEERSWPIVATTIR